MEESLNTGGNPQTGDHWSAKESPIAGQKPCTEAILGAGQNLWKEKERCNGEKPDTGESPHMQLRQGSCSGSGMLLSEPSLEECIDLQFDLPGQDWSQYPPLTLAYIGDAVFDIVIRTVLVKRSRVQAGKLHERASRIVCAASQARIAQALQEELTPEEAAVFRRGRNASPDHHAKNASMKDYLQATGLEALIGYLYLKGDYQRLVWLIYKGTQASERFKDSPDRRTGA